GKRVILRGGDFFLDERAQDAAFHFTQDNTHGQRSYNRFKMLRRCARLVSIADIELETPSVPKQEASLCPVFGEGDANPCSFCKFWNIDRPKGIGCKFAYGSAWGNFASNAPKCFFPNSMRASSLCCLQARQLPAGGLPSPKRLRRSRSSEKR